MDEIVVTACSTKSALEKLKRNGRGTLQLGTTANAAVGPVDVNLGYGLAHDLRGNIAIYGVGGVGRSFGASFNSGGTVQVSNGRSIDDLSGPFYNGGYVAGDVVGGSIDGFSGTSGDGYPVRGGGFTAGAAGGASVSIGYTNTYITPSINVFDILQALLDPSSSC